MSRIKWWHPISQDFNRDPQVRELRRQFGDWMALVWIEMLSISSRNDGRIPGNRSQIAECLSHVSMMNRPRLAAERITNAMQFMVDCGWIEEQTDRVLVLNYAKYNNSRGKDKIPTGEYNPPLRQYNTDKTIQKNIKKEMAAWWNGDAFNQFWEVWPSGKKVKKEGARKSWAKLEPSRELVAKILTAVKIHKESLQWNKDSGDFIPHPTTWLNGRRWEDEITEEEPWEPPEVRATRK